MHTPEYPPHSFHRVHCNAHVNKGNEAMIYSKLFGQRSLVNFVSLQYRRYEVVLAHVSTTHCPLMTQQSILE